MIDFGKLYCDHHPGQIITNFCLKQTCLVSLCATCICTHTQQHMQSQTSPDYQNIRQTYSSMHETIRTKMNSLDHIKNRIGKIVEFIHHKRRAVRMNVQQVKKETFEALNQFFIQKEKRMIKQIEIQQKRVALHSQLRMDSLMNALNRQAQTLIHAAHQLNSQNFLECYKRIKLQILLNTVKVQNQVSNQLDKNQNFQTIINSKNDYLQQIIKILDSSMKIAFKTSSLDMNVQNNESNFYKKQQQNQMIKSSSKTNLSFKNILQNTQKKLNESQTIVQKKQSTSQSIPIFEEDKRVEAIQNKTKRPNLIRNESFEIINDPGQTNFNNNTVWQSNIFKQRDPNQHLNQQNQSKLQNFKKNCQSQLIIGQKKVQKPIYHQHNVVSNGNSNIRYHQQVNKTDFGFYQPANQIPQNINFNDAIYNSRQVVSKIQPKFKNPVIDYSDTPKFLVMPPRTDFIKENFNYQQNLGMSMNANDCKKVRKSGLSLLKTNQSALFSSRGQYM